MPMVLIALATAAPLFEICGLVWIALATAVPLLRPAIWCKTGLECLRPRRIRVCFDSALAHNGLSMAHPVDAGERLRRGVRKPTPPLIILNKDRDQDPRRPSPRSLFSIIIADRGMR